MEVVILLIILLAKEALSFVRYITPMKQPQNKLRKLTLYGQESYTIKQSKKFMLCVAYLTYESTMHEERRWGVEVLL